MARAKAVFENAKGHFAPVYTHSTNCKLTFARAFRLFSLPK
jgi:hypothetical protein